MTILAVHCIACEVCDGMGCRMWHRPKNKQTGQRYRSKWIPCIVCNGRGVHGWSGPAEVMIHKFKPKKPKQLRAAA